jgi:hypothetical protein
MDRSALRRLAKKLLRNSRFAHKKRKVTRTLPFEPLGERLAFSVTASFSPGAGVLSVIGDAQDNTIVSRKTAVPATTS